MTVVIDYEVLKEGKASISGSYMNMGLEGESIVMSEKGNDSSDRGSGSADPPDEAPSKNSASDGTPGGSGSSTAKTPPAAAQQRQLSLVESGGQVAQTAPAAAAAAQEAAPRLVSMDLKDVIDPEEKTVIVPKDDSGQMMPYICTGLGGILVLGGAASALQFRTQLGALQFRLRRRG